MGNLNNVVNHSTKVNFPLDDGTGILDGRMFLHSEDTDDAEGEATKLRCVGSIRWARTKPT